MVTSVCHVVFVGETNEVALVFGFSWHRVCQTLQIKISDLMFCFQLHFPFCCSLEAGLESRAGGTLVH